MTFRLPDIAFDFRLHAYPADELRHLWPEWVEYYRTKAAIAAWIQPSTILEIGVRYGYSGRAFIAGAPAAHYVGIDLDVLANGGTADGFAWARSILPPTAQFIKADTQRLSRLPGGIYDLIHVDGQQTGASTYHDLELASAQGRWILCDGYFWSSENFHAANDFILHQKDIIESAHLLPGYAGELLFRIKDSHLAAHATIDRGTDNTSDALAAFYTQDYFLGNCGGYDSFARHGGRVVTDPRLVTICELMQARRPRRLLDVGCGRGELTLQAALAGATVTAIDYSPDALAIARGSASRLPEFAGRIEWRLESAAQMALSGRFDAAVCGDVVEHLTPPEVDAMYQTVASHLVTDGWFIVHTFPNRWYYDYDYPRRRRQAEAVGAHLPFQPRSRYERLMHINEQRPQVMRRQLRRHFAHVLFWFATPENPEGSLVRHLSPRELAACRDLFAIASHAPIDVRAVLAALGPTPPLSLDEARAIILRGVDVPARMESGQTARVETTLTNGTPHLLGSRLPNPVRLSYHWLPAGATGAAVFDGQRTPIGTVAPGATLPLPATIVAPATPGDYTLQLRIVQENARWHEGPNFDTAALDFLVRID